MGGAQRGAGPALGGGWVRQGAAPVGARAAPTGGRKSWPGSPAASGGCQRDAAPALPCPRWRLRRLAVPLRHNRA